MPKNKKKTSLGIKRSLQDKVEKVKLEAHVLSVEHNRPIDVLNKLSSESSLIKNSFKATINWAKKNNLGKQAKELLNTITDGIVLFLSSLSNKSKE